MKWVKMLLSLVVIACIAGASGLVGYTLGLQKAKDGLGDPKQEDQAKDVVVRVKVVKARNGVIEQTVTAFGTVVASPEDVQTISVPFECRVRRVLAVAGQAVEADTRLVEVEPSPDALLALADARTTRQAAERDLAQVQQRLEMKLATRTELSVAQQALQLARSKLDSMEKRGIEAKQLSAGLSVLVSKVDVQEGQVVPAGGTLMEVVPADRIQVRISVEPSQARQLKPGQAVHIETVQDARRARVEGALKMVTKRINPVSRLVDAYVCLPADSPLMLETFVRAAIIVDRKKALLVPPAAMLQEEGRHVLFTVEGAKAVEHEVEVGLEDEDGVELLAGGVRAGDAVVVQGNAELEQGMAVEVEGDNAPATQGAGADGMSGDGGQS
jgi:RND family efflux transporter MFP subunit